jgi:hypothetical protein
LTPVQQAHPAKKAAARTGRDIRVFIRAPYSDKFYINNIPQFSMEIKAAANAARKAFFPDLFPGPHPAPTAGFCPVEASKGSKESYIIDY